MSYKHPLNLKVKEVVNLFDSGESKSLRFSYESGGKRDFIAYDITDQENLDRYMNRENLGKIDLSAVKNEEDAQKFTEKFMEKYPDLLGKISCRYIASFLDMTPQTLSRERKRRRKDGEKN